jgi:hypothetical protein
MSTNSDRRLNRRKYLKRSSFIVAPHGDSTAGLLGKMAVLPSGPTRIGVVAVWF